jgi:peptidoglycan/xylan/chitin deacetylase (PgdA/CDA1 family)
VSLTFDDGLPSQLDLALPLLEARGFKGTYYVVVDRLRLQGKYRRAVAIPLERWQEIAARGHEIGCHTISHEALTQLDSLAFERELYASQFILETIFPDRPVVSLAYPNSAVNPAVARAARNYYTSARAGSPATIEPVHNDLTRLDLFRLRSLFLCYDGTATQWNEAAATATTAGGWLIETVHAVNASGYCRIPTADLEEHLDYLSGHASELWISPVGPVAERLTRWRRTMVWCRALSADSLEVRLVPEGEPTDWLILASVEAPEAWVAVDPEGGEHPATVERGYLCLRWPAWAGSTLVLRRIPAGAATAPP